MLPYLKLVRLHNRKLMSWQDTSAAIEYTPYVWIDAPDTGPIMVFEDQIPLLASHEQVWECEVENPRPARRVLDITYRHIKREDFQSFWADEHIGWPALSLYYKTMGAMNNTILVDRIKLTKLVLPQKGI
jgi:hypothetical protein